MTTHTAIAGQLGRGSVPSLTASGYNRTDIGVYVCGQDDTYLYGEVATTGEWVRSADGATWTSLGRTVVTDFGADARAIDLVFGGGFMFALIGYADAGGVATNADCSIQRATAGDFSGAWTNVTPTQPAATTGRPSMLAHNGTYLFYGNYGYYSGDTPCKVWRSADDGATWTEYLNVPSGARHVHAVKVDPANPATVAVSLGDGPGSPRGLYLSNDNGVTYTLAGSNEYPIDLAFLPNGDIAGDGDGLMRPHVVLLPNAERSGGHLRSIVWPDLNPTDGLGSWQGTTRGIFEVDGDLFYLTTAEEGNVGSRWGIWMARNDGPQGAWRTVLLEELPGPGWTYPISRIGRTFRHGGWLFNTRSRMSIPALD